jgi:O-antigen/teichoic acid export membrane protein
MTYAVVIAKAGLSDGIIRIFQDYDKDQNKMISFSSTIVLQSIIFSSISTAIYIIILPKLLNILQIDIAYRRVFMVMSVFIIVRPMNIVVMNMMRVNGKTLLLSIVTFLGKVVAIILSLGILLLVPHSLLGYFIGIVIGEILQATVVYSWFFKNYKITYDQVSSDITKKLLLFGMPLLMTELSYNIMSFGDRYIVVSLRNSAELGIYAVGYNMAMYIANLIIFPLSYAIVPIYLKIYHQGGVEKTKDFLARCLNMFIIVIIPMCFGFYAISDGLFITLASIKYVEAAKFAPVILLANLALGLNHILNAGLYLQKKSTTIMAIMFISGVINIIFHDLPDLLTKKEIYAI